MHSKDKVTMYKPGTRGDQSTPVTTTTQAATSLDQADSDDNFI